MDILLIALKNDWVLHREPLDTLEDTMLFTISNKEIHIHKDDIMMGVIHFMNQRMVVDLSKCENNYLRSSLSYFIVKVISSIYIGMPILFAGTGNFY